MTANEKFFAWLDGELEGAEAAAMEARVASDPELERLAVEHRAMQSRLRGAFDAIAAAPVPARIEEAARPKPTIVDLAAAREQRRHRPFGTLPQWVAIAATLVLGVMVGTLVPGRQGGPVEVQGGAIYAAGDIADALDTQLASAPSGDVRIGLTFRNSAGAICRTFTGEASTGIACRDEGRWQIRGMFAAPEGQASDYRMASGMNPALAELVDSTIAGEPFGAAEEASAAERGWK